jgi:outer membrane protein assembly factor BamB/tetratricopeptide (TPR) repeat protein
MQLMPHRSSSLSLISTIFCLLLGLGGLQHLEAQEISMVAVDESPTATMLVQRVLDQSTDNVGQAARGCQELLTRYGSRLVPVSPSEEDRFTTVRERVRMILEDRPELLARFREIEEPVAAGALESGDYGRAVASGWLTPSGLKASLVLAQYELENGHLPQARNRLERLRLHPDLTGREAAHHHYMLGLAAHLQGDVATAAVEAAALEDIPSGEALARRLTRLRDSIPMFEALSVGGLDVHDIPPPDEQGWHQVWTGDLDTSAFSESQRIRSDMGSSSQNILENERVAATTLTAVPLVLEDTVVVSDGSMIRSYDRYGAEAGWSTLITGGSKRRSGLITDLGEISVDGDALFTISGLAYSTGRTQSDGIFCLDLETGAERWRVQIEKIRSDQPSRIGDDVVAPDLDLTGAFPYGSLTVSGGTVVVTARKVNSRRETVIYAIGLDTQSGEVRWVRLLGSSGGIRTQRGFSRSILFEESVIIASPVGVIARLDAMTGEPRWLSRFPVPLSVSDFGTPWEISQPAVVGSDLYAINPDGRGVLRMNVDTGEVLNRWPTGPGTTWGSVRYLIGDEGGSGGPTIYSIGDDVIAMSAKTPGVPRWKLSSSARDEISSRTAPTTRSGTRGRVHVAGSRLLVPGIDDVLLVDALTGRVLEKIPVSGPTNPVLVESQLVLAGLDRIESLMQLGPAEVLLRDRIARDPDNPSRALGLLELGLQSGHYDLSLEAAEQVITCLVDPEDHPRAREILVSMLLRMQTLCLKSDPLLASQAIEYASQVAVTPEQRAQVLLASGDLLAASAEVEAAIESWLKILYDPELADVSIQTDGGVLQANLLVRRRLTGDVGRGGEPISDVVDRLAAVALENAPADQPLVLTTIARRFPGSSTAVKAFKAAAILYEGLGDSILAQDAMLAAVRENPEDAGLRLEAIRLLNRIGSSGDARNLMERGYEIRSMRSDLLSALDDPLNPGSGAWSELPSLGLVPGDALEYPGNILDESLMNQSAGWEATQHSGLLTMVNRSLNYRRSPGDQMPLWSVELPVRDPQVLMRDDDSVLLWFQSANLVPECMLLSLDDGDMIWRSTNIKDVLKPIQKIAGLRGGRQGMMPGGRIFQSQSIVPLLVGDSLLLIRRGGDLASISFDPDEQSGTLEWKAESGLNRIYEIKATDHRLVLSGLRKTLDADGRSVDQSRVVVFDIRSGEKVGEFQPSTSEGIRWLTLDPTGRIVIGTRTSVEAFPMSGTGPPLWTNETPQAAATMEGLMYGDQLVGSLPEGALVGFDLEYGSLRPGAFALSDTSRWLPSGLVSMRSDSDGLVALFDTRLVRFNDDGVVVGVDAVHSARAYFAWIATDQYQFVVDEQTRSIRNGTYRYLIHCLDPTQGLGLVAPSMELESKNRLEQIIAIDQWLLLSTGVTVIAIPMPNAVEPTVTGSIPAPAG